VHVLIPPDTAVLIQLRGQIPADTHSPYFISIPMYSVARCVKSLYMYPERKD
jgi:hypothetical protein